MSRQANFASSPRKKAKDPILARKILLADDSVTAQNMGRKILSEAGFEVITVSNGSAALKKAVEQRPDLIVLDVYMPGYSGLEVCQRLKEMRETARVPVLLTVGKLEPFKPEEARRARADAFIVKPFEASELLAAVRKLEDRIIAGPEPSKPGRLAKLLSRNAPVEVPEKDAGIEEDGWKDRLSIPARPRVLEAQTGMPVPADSQATEPVATSPEVQPAVEERAEDNASDPLADITPEEIAAIKAAAATLTGALDAQPVTDRSEAQAAAASGSERPPEAETKREPTAEPTAVPDEVSPPAGTPVWTEATQSAEPAAAVVEPPPPSLKQDITADTPPRWVAEEVPLQGGEGDASLAREMEVFLSSVATEQSRRAATPAGSNGNVTVETPLAVENRQEPLPVAVPGVEKLESTSQESRAATPQPDEVAEAEAEILDDHAETPSTFAVAVMTEAPHESSPVPAESSAIPAEAAHALPETPSAITQTAAVSSVEVGAQSAMAMAASASASAAAPPALPVENDQASPPSASSSAATSENAVTQGAGSPGAVQGPAVETAEPSTGDKMGAAEMAAAWSHWQEIRQSIVGSGLTDQITEVAAAAARASETNSQGSTASSAGKPEASFVASEESAPPQPSASAQADPSAIASIVDSVLAELKPKLVEEIAKKLGEKK
jgi:CheY-like chemotaxis protein